MCLAIPGRVVQWLNRDPTFAQAEVEFEGVRRVCHMACVIDAEEGDYVIVHAGVAISRLNEDQARQTLEDFARLGELDSSDGAAIMKYLDEFRDPVLARRLLDEIRCTVTRPRVLMEVCGGQTHSLLRHGIEAELQGVVELIHGPGCPVCVTPAEAIDFAQELASRPAVVLASFGDMLRVPGTTCSLLDVRGEGGDVRVVYSPLDAVELAKNLPNKQVVFFAVGFETTAPATALAVLQAAELGLENFSLLVSHVRVLPAMEALMLAPGCRVEGFLAAGHVCTVTGFDEYTDFVERHRTPVAVTGFEPVDLLDGILDCVKQLESGRADVTNRYSRSVRKIGNDSAQDVVDRVYEIADTPWRGLGVINCGGYQMRSEFETFDASRRFESITGGCQSESCFTKDCRSGEVLSGLIKPTQCEAFGTRCTPDSPLGAPMVSSEGACAAYFRYEPLAKGAVREVEQTRDRE